MARSGGHIHRCIRWRYYCLPAQVGSPRQHNSLARRPHLCHDPILGGYTFICVVPGIAGTVDEAFDAVRAGAGVHLGFVGDVGDVDFFFFRFTFNSEPGWQAPSILDT